MAKNTKTVFFRKVAISLKVSVVEYWDQLFWIPRFILLQKRSLSPGKNLIFNFFTQKVHFYHFCHNNLGRFCRFLLLHSKTRLLPWYLENIKKRPSLCSARLGCARSRFTWVYHDHCDSSGKNVILVIKKRKNCFLLVSKGCYWCKMRGGIQKSWSQCATTLTFSKIAIFLKKMVLLFFATNLSQPFF